jgi:hypothetical protein
LYWWSERAVRSGRQLTISQSGKEGDHTADQVLEALREHSRAQALTPYSHYSQQASVYGDHHHGDSVEAMCETQADTLNND